MQGRLAPMMQSRQKNSRKDRGAVWPRYWSDCHTRSSGGVASYCLATVQLWETAAQNHADWSPCFESVGLSCESFSSGQTRLRHLMHWARTNSRCWRLDFLAYQRNAISYRGKQVYFHLGRLKKPSLYWETYSPGRRSTFSARTTWQWRHWFFQGMHTSHLEWPTSLDQACRLQILHSKYHEWLWLSQNYVED